MLYWIASAFFNILLNACYLFLFIRTRVRIQHFVFFLLTCVSKALQKYGNLSVFALITSFLVYLWIPLIVYSCDSHFEYFRFRLVINVFNQMVARLALQCTLIQNATLLENTSKKKSGNTLRDVQHFYCIESIKSNIFFVQCLLAKGWFARTIASFIVEFIEFPESRSADVQHIQLRENKSWIETLFLIKRLLNGVR